MKELVEVGYPPPWCLRQRRTRAEITADLFEEARLAQTDPAGLKRRLREKRAAKRARAALVRSFWDRYAAIRTDAERRALFREWAHAVRAKP